MRRRLSPGRPRDAGQAATEVVGILTVVAMLVGVAAVAFERQREDVGRAVTCAVARITGDHHLDCAPSTGGGQPRPGEPGAGSGEPGSQPGGEPVPGPEGRPIGETPESCDDVLYSHQALAHQVGTGANPVYLRIGCQWYPVPEQCRGLLEDARNNGPWAAGLRPNEGHDVSELVGCVGGRSGPTGEDQDLEECRDTLPHTAPEQPTVNYRVQVGCREYVVPEQCTQQWQAWDGRTATPGGPREAALGTDLAGCVMDYYEKAEPFCVVSSDRSTTTEESRVLWIKFTDSEGMLVEELGDGRWRVHVLRGKNLGFAAETPTPKKGDFPQAGASMVRGVESSDTVEFADGAAAEAWVQWRRDYDDARGKDFYVEGKQTWYRNHPARPHSNFQGGATASPVSDERARQLQDILDREPAHRVIAASTTKIQEIKVEAKGDRSFSRGEGVKGSVAPGGDFSYTGKVEVESRHLTDGGFVGTYRATDEWGLTLLLKLGGTKKLPENIEAKLKGQAGVGGEFKAEVAFSVVWNADGSVRQITTSTSDQALANLTKSTAGAEIKLPYGFGIEGSGGARVQQGKDAVVEHILNLEAHPDLRDDVTPLVDELFPGGRDHALTGSPGLSFDGTDDDGPEDAFSAAAKKGVTRELAYNVKEQERTGEAKLTFAGMTVVGWKQTKVDTAKNLTDSSLTVTDVDGMKQVLPTAPMCNHRSVDPATYDYDDGLSLIGR